MSQISFFDGSQPLKITKPIRLIECFAGYGSQAFALKYLGVKFEHWKIAEWAVKSIQAYKDMHFADDDTDYSAEHSKQWLIDYLFEKGISADYNKPMTREQIARMGEDKIRRVYNNIIASHNLVSVTNVKGEDLDIRDTDRFTYLLTYSFPCQDLSQAGLSKGMQKGGGTRSGLLWEIERILDECEELPQILLMENVPQVIGEKNRDAFRDWFCKLESLGYKSYYTIMNGKDYEIPQNRERCFMVSCLGDCYYDFPPPKPLKLRLKDMLEAEVDEKYYLSNKTVEMFVKHTEKKQAHGYFDGSIEHTDVISTIDTGVDNWHTLIGEPKCEQVGEIQGSGYNEMTGRVYGSNGLSPTVRTFCGGGQEIKIAVNSATKSGYEIAEVGDSIDIAYPNSNTRRGRVGKGVAQTLLTSDQMAVLEEQPRIAECIGGIGEKKSNGGTQYYQQDRIYSGDIALAHPANLPSGSYYYTEPTALDEQNGYVRRDGTVGTLTTDGSSPKHNNRIIEGYKIRKLTPKECFRLMGVKDEDFERVARNQSNSSLYHLAGDSIITNCLMAIFKQML